MFLIHNHTFHYHINSTYYFILKIPNKRELQQIASNHSSGINFTDFMKIYNKCIAGQ